MQIQKIHHVAYRCKDAKQTVEWYGKYLNMDFILAIAENEVPSTKEPDPYMHVFLDAGGGNVLAFFELPTKPEMGRDPNTPAWTQHLAMQVATVDELLETRLRRCTMSRHYNPAGTCFVPQSSHQRAQSDLCRIFRQFFPSFNARNLLYLDYNSSGRDIYF